MVGVRIRWGLLTYGALLLLGCGPWDLAALEARHPALARVGAAPLAELSPYFVAIEDELTGFVCRWPTDAKLRVRVVGEARPEDLALLDLALASWASTSIGVGFERVSEAGDIEVGFADASESRSGVAAVDCRLRPGGEPDRLDAELVFAQITLRREALDWKGDRIELGDDERLGAALHELGHALGFQGHPARGDTVMLRSVDHVRWAGASVLRGASFRDEALAALYSVPSGSILGRVPLPAGRTRELDVARRRAAAKGQRDWWIRVGDRAARIDWGPGTEAFYVPNVRKIFQNSSTFEPVLLGEL